MLPPDAGNEIWKTVWSLNTLNVVKNFMWRACHNLLPTIVNLYRRGVVKDTVCPRCGKADETVIHALWSCPAGQDV